MIRKKTSIVAILFGFISYLGFLIVFNYQIAFVGDLFVPITIDMARTGSLFSSVIVDLGLVTLFGIQHTIMADPMFKRWITRFIPECYERPLFVAVSTIALAFLMWQWRSIDIVIWQVEAQWAVWLIWGLFTLGWGILYLSTFLIDHWHLFGLKQALGRDFEGVTRFVTPSLYKLVRHPMMTGITIAIWAAPTMTLGHLIFSASMTTYLLVGIRFEERKLVQELGSQYELYQKNIPALVPTLKKKHDINTVNAE
ncbi:MAG: isoprenylcysteine carboxylmethyltransferase family protein [Kordiimonadaceae bacterium]|jgi:methanethiol S-methyltransferase|nr:isoprenylcysteine carboxylmethyltransferase family protein [Kordiimonadaceae bacterium]MBT6036302.1 isoprenylcysteine carboxylmethyltransferase family protein [Kordiimonadaceae bacterium]MBT6328331.1 isoprenylcysteine carboxylmethyltransferase family protein [Kordiimonadaceae bacterium]